MEGKKSFLISGDIHLRIKPDIPEDWQIERYRALWRHYIGQCKIFGMTLVLSGDIFDNHKITSKEAMLFAELLTMAKDTNIDTLIIDGNHDYSNPNDTTLSHFEPWFEMFNSDVGAPCIDYVSDFSMDIGNNTILHLVGHSKLKNHDAMPVKGMTNILVSHFRPDVNEYIKEEIDVSKFTKGYDYTFASDIHCDLELPGNIIFTNSPINSSFEPNPKCGCLVVDIDANGKVSWGRNPTDHLPNLVQINTTPEEYAKGLKLGDKHYYRVSISGDPEKLRELKSDATNVKLMKIPDQVETYVEQEETTEIKDAPLEDDLVQYMQGLDFTDQKISKMMGVFYVKTVD